MYYARPCEHRRVTAADAHLIPWNMLTSIKQSAGCVEMCFSGRILFPDHGISTRHIVLRKSRLLRTLRRHFAARRRMLRVDAANSDASTD